MKMKLDKDLDNVSGGHGHKVVKKLNNGKFGITSPDEFDTEHDAEIMLKHMEKKKMHHHDHFGGV